MDTLGIKNASQVKTWWRWYQNDELYRFHHPVGNNILMVKGWSSYLKLNSYICR